MHLWVEEKSGGIFLGRFRVRSRDSLRLGCLRKECTQICGVASVYAEFTIPLSSFCLSVRLSLSLVYDRTMLLISQFGKCRQWAAVTGLKRRAEKAAKKEVSLFSAQHFPQMFLCLEAAKPRVCKIRKISIKLL